MKTKHHNMLPLLCFPIFLLLIFDSNTAITAASNGISLCMRSVIPSLFPFFLLSGIISTSVFGTQSYRFAKFCKLIGIPIGCESLFLLGILSGYPVGAQNIKNAYSYNGLPIKTARRMLGFCNNAGPAFIFGILGPMFRSRIVPFALWGLHIFSALLTGLILPGKDNQQICLEKSQPISFNTVMEKSLKSIASVSGWVIIFRIIIAFADKWFLDEAPLSLSVLLFGLLELTNGCLLLPEIYPQGLCFILSALLINAGGICVAMQTLSVTKEIGLGMYFPGKALQTAISVLMATITQYSIFADSEIYTLWCIPFAFSVFTIIILLLYLKLKNRYSILKEIVV